MKKCLIFSTLFIYLLLISAQLTLSRSQQEFVDHHYRYSVKHPSDWKASIYRSGIVVANINSPDNNSGLQIRILDSNQPIDRFVSGYVTDYRKSMNAVLIDQGKNAYGPFHGYWATFQSDRNGKRYFLKSYIIPAGDNRIFVFQSGTPFEQRNSCEITLDSIASSFRLR